MLQIPIDFPRSYRLPLTAHCGRSTGEEVAQSQFDPLAAFLESVNADIAEDQIVHELDKVF